MSAQLASRHDRSEILRGVDLSGLDSQVASVLLDMARQETKPRSEAVASFILKVFKEKITELSSQPLRYAAFSVLKSPDIPSILIEAGFMSTSSDLQNLTTKNGEENLQTHLPKLYLAGMCEIKRIRFY